MIDFAYLNDLLQKNKIYDLVLSHKNYDKLERVIIRNRISVEYLYDSVLYYSSNLIIDDKIKVSIDYGSSFIGPYSINDLEKILNMKSFL